MAVYDDLVELRVSARALLNLRVQSARDLPRRSSIMRNGMKPIFAAILATTAIATPALADDQVPPAEPSDADTGKTEPPTPPHPEPSPPQPAQADRAACRA